MPSGDHFAFMKFMRAGSMRSRRGWIDVASSTVSTVRSAPVRTSKTFSRLRRLRWNSSAPGSTSVIEVAARPRPSWNDRMRPRISRTTLPPRRTEREVVPASPSGR
ncbi:MAG: hypothetical protein ACOCX4_05240 [Planctomycetota bacterium]